MPRGRQFGTQRVLRTDPATGVPMIQVTGGGSAFAASTHMHYEATTFTPDGERMIFVALIEGRPGRVLLGARSDGQEIVQLSGDGDVCGAVLSAEGEAVYYVESGILHRTALADAYDVEIGRLDVAGARVHRAWHGTLAMGRWFFAEIRRDPAGAGMVRWDVTTGLVEDIYTADETGHPKANPAGREVSFNVYRFLEGRDEKGKRNFEKRTVSLDAESLEEIEIRFPRGPHGVAHSYWLGTTGKYQGTMAWPGHGIQIMERDADEPRIIESPGPYFWHSGASYDGRWIVADTNFPWEGIWLVNVETGKSGIICRPPINARDIEKPYAHPSPNLSDDGRRAIFTFTFDGAAHAVVAPVPEDLRRQLASPD